MISDPMCEPFWTMAEELDFSIGFHEGSTTAMPTVGVDRFEDRAARHMISHTMEMMLAAVTTRKCSECTTSWTKHERAARWYVRSTLGGCRSHVSDVPRAYVYMNGSGSRLGCATAVTRFRPATITS